MNESFCFFSKEWSSESHRTRSFGRVVTLFDAVKRSSDESGTIVGTDPKHLECLFILRELLQIPLGKLFLDGILIGRINKRDTRPFESSSRESSTIHSRQLAHDLIDSDQLRTSALIVMDAALTTCKREFSE